MFALTVPMVGGMLSLVAFNLADTYFVSRLGTDPLAAMGFTFPVVMLIGMVAMGLGMGTSSVISRAIGQGDHSRVRRVTTDSLILGVVLVAILAATGVLTMDPVFRWLGAREDLLGLIRQYMTIWYVGVVFLVIPMVGNHAIRASGDTIRPSLIMMISAGVNVVLDPILIFGWWIFPRMELRGAALATVISRALTLVASLAILHYGKRMLTFRRPTLRAMGRSWKAILHVGIPSGATMVLYPLSMAVVTRLVAQFGKTAVAAVGAANRVEAFAMMVMWSLASVLLPFVGQNWGAGLADRVDRARKVGNRFAMVWGAFCTIVLVATAGPIASLFSDDAEVMARIRLYLYILPIGYGLRGACVLAPAVFNGMGRPMVAAALNILRMFGLYVPLAWLGSKLYGLGGLFAGLSLANMIAGVVALVWMHVASADGARMKSTGHAAAQKAD